MIGNINKRVNFNTEFEKHKESQVTVKETTWAIYNANDTKVREFLVFFV